MSTRWEITKAVRASDLPSPARLIMFVLADVAEVGTAEIPEKFTPSVSVLARETGLSKSTVQRHLNDLETAGWIARTRPATPQAMWAGDRVRYRLTVPEGVVAEIPTLVSEEYQGGVTDTPGVVAEIPRGGSAVTPLETDLLTDTDQELKNLLPHKSAASKAKRGTRIPDDFRVTPELVAWARENVPNVDGRRETEKFINYWTAKSGRDATKLKWDATWKNWMLTAAERGPRGKPAKPSVLDDPAVRAAYDELFPPHTEDVA